MCGRVLGVELANPLDERLHPSLLKDAHERGLESLSSIRGDLGNGGLGTSTLLDEAARHLLELEIAGHFGGDENVGKLARGHEELGDEINVPVVGTAILFPGLLALAEVSILLEKLCRHVSLDDCSLGDLGRVGAVSVWILGKVIPPRGSRKRPHCGRRKRQQKCQEFPAIVVVAVDVKDLLALDTQDTLKGVLAGMELRGGSSGEAPQ